MKNYPALLIFILATGFLSAQDTTSSKCSLKPLSISLNSGMNFYRDFTLSLIDLENIAPTAAMPHSDFSGFNTNSPYNLVLLNATSEFAAKMEFSNKKEPVHILNTTTHCGFNYSAIDFVGPSFYRNYSHRYDTITSGNLTLYMDSSHYENYNFSWSTEAVSLDFGQDFHSDQRKIFSAGFGYGIAMGACINSHYTGYYNVADILSATSANTMAGSANNFSESDSSQFETIRTKTTFFARAYCPFFVQFRFSRKDNFFNHLAMTIEGRTGIDLIDVPGLGVQARPFYTQMFGFKYYFEKAPTMRKRTNVMVTPSY